MFFFFHYKSSCLVIPIVGVAVPEQEAIDPYDLIEAVEILSKLPKDFYENLVSAYYTLEYCVMKKSQSIQEINLIKLLIFFIQLLALFALHFCGIICSFVMFGPYQCCQGSALFSLSWSKNRECVMF